jgi:bacteriocin-like protein
MDSTARTSADLPFEVLTDEELETVVGGGDLRSFNAQDFVYNKIGMCGCGLAH